MGEIIIPRGIGKPIRGIYSPEVQKIAEALGTVETRRASHVEPGSMLSAAAIQWLDAHYKKDQGEWEGYNQPQSLYTEMALDRSGSYLMDAYKNQWWADCLPVGGPVLGPFPDRDTALAEESKWLHANNIPTCRTCADNPTHDAAVSPTGRNPSDYEPQMQMIPRMPVIADPEYIARIERMLETTRNQPSDTPVSPCVTQADLNQIDLDTD